MAVSAAPRIDRYAAAFCATTAIASVSRSVADVTAARDDRTRSANASAADPRQDGTVENDTSASADRALVSGSSVDRIRLASPPANFAYSSSGPFAPFTPFTPFTPLTSFLRRLGDVVRRRGADGSLRRLRSQVLPAQVLVRAGHQAVRRVGHPCRAAPEVVGVPAGEVRERRRQLVRGVHLAEPHRCELCH